MHRVRIIGEIGINHNGNVEIAKQLASVAKECGCDYVKLQKRDIDLCYDLSELRKPCDSVWGTTIGDKVRGREMSWDDFKSFDRYAREIGIGWSASCFDLLSLQQLHELFPDRPFNKVASAMAMHRKFLAAVAAQGKLTLISTGLLTDKQIQEASKIFEAAKCQYVINHTIAVYPCDDSRLNLRVIQVLIELFHLKDHCAGVGYSGHERGILPSTVAAMLGASWIERHITLDRASYGADQAASLEPAGLSRLVRDIHSLDSICGDGRRQLKGDEKNPVKKFVENPEAALP